MASSSNNNRQVLTREWDRFAQRRRVSPLPVRGFRRGYEVSQVSIGDFNWYKIIVSIQEYKC